MTTKSQSNVVSLTSKPTIKPFKVTTKLVREVVVWAASEEEALAANVKQWSEENDVLDDYYDECVIEGKSVKLAVGSPDDILSEYAFVVEKGELKLAGSSSLYQYDVDPFAEIER